MQRLLRHNLLARVKMGFCFVQTYVRSSDKQFVAHTIQAIARCATNISEVTDTCLSGLVSLLSNRDGESLVNVVNGILWLSCF